MTYTVDELNQKLQKVKIEVAEQQVEVQKLVLDEKSVLDAQTMQNIESVLKADSTIAGVSFHGCRLTDPHACMYMYHLSQISTLKYLNFENATVNWFSENFLTIFKSQALVKVNFQKSGLTDAVIERLVWSSLPRNGSLQELDIRNNQITNAGARALLKALESNKTLTHIHVEGIATITSEVRTEIQKRQNLKSMVQETELKLKLEQEAKKAEVQRQIGNFKGKEEEIVAFFAQRWYDLITSGKLEVHSEINRLQNLGDVDESYSGCQRLLNYLNDEKDVFYKNFLRELGEARYGLRQRPKSCTALFERSLYEMRYDFFHPIGQKIYTALELKLQQQSHLSEEKLRQENRAGREALGGVEGSPLVLHAHNMMQSPSQLSPSVDGRPQPEGVIPAALEQVEQAMTEMNEKKRILAEKNRDVQELLDRLLVAQRAVVAAQAEDTAATNRLMQLLQVSSRDSSDSSPVQASNVTKHLG